MRLVRVVALSLLLNCAAGPIVFADAAIVVVDSAHHELRFDHSPQRIVTLLPSLTESVCELGECARLVATDRFSNWPASVQRLPKTGGVDDAQIEQIVRVKPDVVLLAHASRVTERLRGLGLVTLELDTQTYADIAGTISTLGVLLAVPERAAALNREIERSVSEVAADAGAHLRGRSARVYFEVDAGPYGAGPQSFIGVMLARLGARNILTADLGPFPKLNPEYVVRQNPDVIFVSPTEAPQLVNRPGWDRIRAVREQRLCAFAPEVRDTIVRPGPRVAEGFRAMANCLVRVTP
jgi:iron complex transport system substrate-binding protein